MAFNPIINLLSWTNSPITWHKRALLFHALTLTIAIFLAVVLTLTSIRGGATGVAEIFSGHCNAAININRCLQAILALTAISISVSFDFFLRLAASPTADDLHQAHSQGRSFDIGIHSVRNVRQISPRRRVAWLLIALAAIPLQLFFHSSAIIAFDPTLFSRMIVSKGFHSGDAFQYPGVANLAPLAYEDTELKSEFDGILPGFQSAASQWDLLDAKDCGDTYFRKQAGPETHRNILLVVESGPDLNPSGWKGEDIWGNTTPPAYSHHAMEEYRPEMVNSLWSYALLCFQDTFSARTIYKEPANCAFSTYGAPFIDTFDPLDLPVRETTTTSWKIIWGDLRYTVPDTGHTISSKFNLEFQNLTVQYCFAEPSAATCKLFASRAILLVNFICVLVGSSCSAFISRLCWKQESCQCLGDTVQVFLTARAIDCESHYESTQLRNQTSSLNSPEPPGQNAWQTSQIRWGHAVTRSVWLWTYMPTGIFLIIAVTLFGWLGRDALRNERVFGESLSNAAIDSTKWIHGPSWFTTYCIVANLPQVVIATYYFVFSSLYSSLFQNKEWADFTIKAQPLRVSFPTDQQAASYPLQYPSFWGFSFILLKVALGWMLTQSFYLVLTAAASPSTWHLDLDRDFDGFTIQLGYSARAILAFIILLAVAASIPVVLSFHSLPKGSVVVGADSAAIAAYCPRNTSAGVDGNSQDQSSAWEDIWTSRRYLRPLRWGVLSLGRVSPPRAGVLGLGSEDEILGLPVDGQKYVPVGALRDGFVPSQNRMQLSG